MGTVIWDSVYRTQFRGYLENKVRLSPVKFDRIDWDTTSHAMQVSPVLYIMWSEKEVAGIWSVVNIMKIWGL